MATLAGTARPVAGDDGFFLGAAIAMALVLVAGFSLQLGMGRSSFSSPILVHAHAVVFMGWVAIYVAQNALVASGNTALHRRVGWLAAGWMAAMLGLGCAVTVAMVRRGQVPFFFTPVQFLVFDPVTLFAFVGLGIAAIALRRRTDWHRRLHFCGMSMLLGPGFGRLLPMPLLAPWAYEATFAATLLFPIAGIIADRRRRGRVHPAWGRGIAAMLATFVLVEAISGSGAGTAIYDAVVAGSPGADIEPRAFAPPPPGMRITGRSG